MINYVSEMHFQKIWRNKCSDVFILASRTRAKAVGIMTHAAHSAIGHCPKSKRRIIGTNNTEKKKKTEISLFCTDCCAASQRCWKNFVCSTLKIYISYKSNYTLLSFWVLLVFHHHLRLSFVLFSLINDSSCNFWMNAFELDSQNSAFQMCTCIALRFSNQLINSIELI